jgi:hypothetical protein
MSALIIALISVLSCQPRIQVGPEKIESSPALQHLPKPSHKLSEAQFRGLPVGVQVIIEKREIEWNGIYRDYLRR